MSTIRRGRICALFFGIFTNFCEELDILELFLGLFLKDFGVLKNVLLTRMDGVWLVGWICLFTGNAAFAQ